MKRNRLITFSLFALLHIWLGWTAASSMADGLVGETVYLQQDMERTDGLDRGFDSKSHSFISDEISPDADDSCNTNNKGQTTVLFPLFAIRASTKNADTDFFWIDNSSARHPVQSIAHRLLNSVSALFYLEEQWSDHLLRLLIVHNPIILHEVHFLHPHKHAPPA